MTSLLVTSLLEMNLIHPMLAAAVTHQRLGVASLWLAL
jgi:hypothetical protein